MSSGGSSSNLQKKIQELRVADQELHSGDQTGRIFLQLSVGSAAFLTERSVAQARVVRQLHRAIEQEDQQQTSLCEKSKHDKQSRRR